MHRHPDALHHHQPPYHIAGTHVARVTNYPACTGRNHDGSPYGGNRIAADWRFYPKHSVIAFFLHGRVVEARVCDTGPAVRGPRHFDFPTRLLGLGSRGTATGVRFWVVRWGDGRPVVRLSPGRSLEEWRAYRRHHHRYRRHNHIRHYWRLRARLLRRLRRIEERRRELRRHNRFGRGPCWSHEHHAEHFERVNRARVRLRHRRHHPHRPHPSGASAQGGGFAGHHRSHS